MFNFSSLFQCIYLEKDRRNTSVSSWALFVSSYKQFRYAFVFSSLESILLKNSIYNSIYSIYETAVRISNLQIFSFNTIFFHPCRVTKIELSHSDKSFFVLQNQSIKFPFFFLHSFLLIRIAHKPNKIFALPCAKKKKKRTLFLPIFITRSFTRVQQLLSTVCKRWKGSKGATLESKLPFCCAPLFRVDHRSITGSIRNISSASLSFETPAQAPGNNEPRCTFWSLRDPIASLPCYPAVLSKQYAPLAACLRINREHAPLFHPRETSLPLLPPPPSPLVQSSRSKAFKVISVNSREKKLAHCRRWFSTMHRYRIEDGVHRPGSRSRNRLQSVTWITSLFDIKRDKI